MTRCSLLSTVADRLLVSIQLIDPCETGFIRAARNVAPKAFLVLVFMGPVTYEHW